MKEIIYQKFLHVVKKKLSPMKKRETETCFARPCWPFFFCLVCLRVHVMECGEIATLKHFPNRPLNDNQLAPDTRGGC